MATHSSVLAWRIPGMGEPGGLPYGVAQSRTQLKRLSSSSREVFKEICIAALKSFDSSEKSHVPSFVFKNGILNACT